MKKLTKKKLAIVGSGLLISSGLACGLTSMLQPTTPTYLVSNQTTVNQTRLSLEQMITKDNEKTIINQAQTLGSISAIQTYVQENLSSLVYDGLMQNNDASKQTILNTNKDTIMAKLVSGINVSVDLGADGKLQVSTISTNFEAANNLLASYGISAIDGSYNYDRQEDTITINNDVAP